MAVERKLISENIKKLEVKEFLKKELARAGCGEIDVQRTPLGTRIILHAQRPGLVIGRRGASIRKSTNILSKRYGIDNPQIEVNELPVPELNAQVMAESIASSLERGIHFRRAAYTAMRRIMEAGARGVEIEISGKLTGERSKSVKFVDGSLKRCGEPALIHVRRGFSEAAPKPGLIGVKVQIMPPGITLPDEIVFTGEKEAEEGKKLVGVKEEIEKLVENIEEELSVVDEETIPKKKVKVEKVKRKKVKKVEEEPVEETEEAEKAEKEKPEVEEAPKPRKRATKKKVKKQEKKDGDTEK